jgi:hypothetical protein
MQVSITPVDEPDALFCHYPSQSQPQDAFLELDLQDGVMRCDYGGEIGNGYPESVFHGRVLRFTIPALTATAANLLLDEAVGLAQRILAGAEIVWNGNNHVGRLDQDATAAAEALSELCSPDNFSESDLVGEWQAVEWYTGQSREDTITSLGLTADTTDQQLATLAEQQQREAREIGSDFGYVVLTGAQQYLTELRDELVRRRDELAKYDVVTKSPALGSYDEGDEGLALQYEGVWQADLTAAQDAVARVAEDLDVEATSISLVPGRDSYAGDPRWTFAFC